jgi:hypothetical protein
MKKSRFVDCQILEVLKSTEVGLSVSELFRVSRHKRGVRP